MLEVQVNRFGGPEVLTPRQGPDPAAGPGQVVIETVAVDVLLVDTLIRSGRGVGFFPVRPPYVPGDGVAGHVIAVGDGVDTSWTGRAVVARTGGGGDGLGGYTERAVVPAADLIPVPPGLGLLEAAALLHDGTTAFGLLEAAVIKPGAWVLITAPGGQFFAHGMSDGGFARLDTQQAARRGITVHGIERAQHEPATIRRLAGAALAEAAAGRLRPVIGQTFPLDRAADAHAALEARATVAKTLLITA